MKTLWKTAVFAAFLAAPALATTLIALDLPALSRAADAIVQGTVTEVQAKASKDGRRISTHVLVQVSDRLKGDAVQTVEVVQPGGELGDIGQKVAGTAHFKTGDEVVLFLKRRGAEAWQPVGLAQGCFKVQRSTDGKSAFAVQDPEGDVLLLDPVTHAPVQKDFSPVTLDALKARVRTSLGSGSGTGVIEAPVAPAAPQKATK